MQLCNQLAICVDGYPQNFYPQHKFIWGNAYITNHKIVQQPKISGHTAVYSVHDYTYNNTIVTTHQHLCMHVYSCVCNMRQLWLLKAVTYGQYRTSFLLLSSSSMLASSWTICNKTHIYICNCILTLHCNVYNSYSYVHRYICHH